MRSNWRSYALAALVVAVQIHLAVFDRERSAEKANLVKKHLKRLKKHDGAIKLIGGRGEFEGNVEVLHNGQWGAVCDDEWDDAEARVVCRQLGYMDGTGRATDSAAFGPARRRYWMDNVYCDGTEDDVTTCRFDGWGQSDCKANEAAGVVCHEEVEDVELSEEVQVKTVPEPVLSRINNVSQIRLRGGRIPEEGRVEIKFQNGSWEVICGDGWSLLEAMVVCRSLDLGHASDAPQTDFFGGKLTSKSLRGVKCYGSEKNLSECLHTSNQQGTCPGNDVAAVYCVNKMSDLVIDHIELMRTAFLEDKQLYFLQCAMEENCLASEAYAVQKESPSWHLETRRLLRFTARILNAGTDDFKPSIPKHLWEWHMCHMHYHSMEVFATFDIINKQGVRVAEGHKASFCLEDNQCLPGVKPRYACANYGDQGISVNCSDIYHHSVDCQWVDISDLNPGVYTLKVAVNPEFKVPEISFDNNAAVCTFYYTETFGQITNCSVQRP